jgi:hypothetical protein
MHTSIAEILSYDMHVSSSSYHMTSIAEILGCHDWRDRWRERMRERGRE